LIDFDEHDKKVPKKISFGQEDGKDISNLLLQTNSKLTINAQSSPPGTRKKLWKPSNLRIFFTNLQKL
jgi:hypothetical protein